MVKSTIKALGEFGLIDQIQKLCPMSSDVVVGIGDDTAVIKRDARYYTLLTTDMLIENVHFTRRMSPQQVGHKALACSLSDIAAMGGKAQQAVVALGLPAHTSAAWVTSLYRGMKTLAKKFNVSIVGGDMTRSEVLAISVTVTGVVWRSKVCLRSGARPGDQIFVTGPLGHSLTSGHHLTFTPRLHEAQYLTRYCQPSAMMDISDGLAQDLGHMLKSSRVGAVIHQEAIPCRRRGDWQAALQDGEDFELLFTLPLDKAAWLRRRLRRKDQFYCIGAIIKGSAKIHLQEGQGHKQEIALKGYQHF